MKELGTELVHVLDCFQIPQVTCLADGAGANICAQFAIKHKHRCFGVALIHPTGKTNSALGCFVESFKDKFNIRRQSISTGLLSSSDLAFLIFHKFGETNVNSKVTNIKDFQKKIIENRNQKNLSLFIESFLR